MQSNHRIEINNLLKRIQIDEVDSIVIFSQKGENIRSDSVNPTMFLNLIAEKILNKENIQSLTKIPDPVKVAPNG